MKGTEGQLGQKGAKLEIANPPQNQAMAAARLQDLHENQAAPSDAIPESPRSQPSPPFVTPSPEVLNSLERGIIDYFVHLFRIFNLPKSVAEIYGLLFSSEKPLNMDDIIRRLEMSKGAVSQGLKLLRGYGALRVVYIQADRRDHYTVELGMRRLAEGFLKEQLEPHLQDARGRLEAIDKEAVHQSAGSEVVTRRIENLKSWQNKGRRMIPLMLRMLGK